MGRSTNRQTNQEDGKARVGLPRHAGDNRYQRAAVGFLQSELSDREKEVLKLICGELTMKEIGQKLFLSENTVRNHRVNIMEKVGARNMVGLVLYALKNKLVDPDV